LVADNATIFTSHIGKITPTGFIDHEGKEHSADVIICATGFDTSWSASQPPAHTHASRLTPPCSP